MPHFNDMLFHLGGMPLLPPGFPFTRDSKYYFVDPERGSDSNAGTDIRLPLATIITAEDKCVAGQHDVVFYIGGDDSVSMTAALTWDKDYTHLIGLGAPTMVGQRTRIFQLSTLTGASPLLDITATGCIFSNFYIFQGVADATSLLNVRVTGGRNYFHNVHFAGGGHATQAIDGGASLALYGGAECTFDNCTIGVDTIAAATGMMGMRIDSDAKRCIFRDCTFTMYAGAGGAGFVEVVDSAGFDRYLIFKDCLFINDAAAQAMDSAFVIPGGMGSVTHRIFLKNSPGIGFTDWDASDSGLIYIDEGTKTGGTNAGIALVSAS